jgi:excisionase family DNA binding protein
MKTPSKNSGLETGGKLIGFSNLPGDFSNKDKISGIPKYLTIAQVAEILEVSQDYVRTLIKNGRLESVKLPGGSASPVRISSASLQNLINNSKASGQNIEQSSSGKRKRKQKAYYGVFSV